MNNLLKNSIFNQAYKDKTEASLAITTSLKTNKKSLIEKYHRDFSKDAFVVNKGEKTRALLQKSGYLKILLQDKS